MMASGMLANDGGMMASGMTTSGMLANDGGEWK